MKWFCLRARRRRWHERGLWINAPGQVWSDDVHDADARVVVVEGDVELDIEGKVHRPAAGEELFIPSRARNMVRNGYRR